MLRLADATPFVACHISLFLKGESSHIHALG